MTTTLAVGVHEEQPLTSPVPCPVPPLHVPSPTMVTKVATAPVTLDIRINTLIQLPEESKIMDKYVIAKYISRGIDGVSLMYEWASH
jgi:hypothetical protein